MRIRIALSVAAVGMALAGCSTAEDPVGPQVSAEEARGAAAERQAEAAEHGGAEAEGDHGGAEAGGDHGSEGSSTGSAGAGDAAGEEPEATTSAETGGGSTGAEGADAAAGALTDQALTQFEQQFPVVSTLASEDRLRALAGQVCTAIESGGTEQGQQVVEQIPGVDTSTAAQVVGFLDREVCR